MFAILKGGIALLVVAFNLFLAFLVLVRNPRHLINIIFFLISLIFALWALFLFFYEFPYIFSSLFWIKATYLAAVGYIGLIFFFSFIFPTSAFRKAWVYAYIVGILYSLLSVWLLLFTKLWVVDVVVDPVKGLQTILGPAYIWWTLGGWLFIVWAVVNFILKTRYATPPQKIQIRYFWIGFIMFGIGVSVCDVIIPLSLHDTRIFIFGTATNLFFSGATAYVILRHRFLDIRSVVSRSLTYLFLVLLLGVFYAKAISLVTSSITGQEINQAGLFVSVAAALLITFSFQPLLALLKKLTNRIFYKERYDETALFQKLTTIMVSTIYLHDLTRTLLDEILNKMHISQGAFVLVDNKKIFHLAHRGYKTPPKFAEEDLDNLTRQNQIAVFAELPEGFLRETMGRLEASVIVPLWAKMESEDILVLGEKLSGDPYTIQDINLLEIFAPEATIAIENISSIERLRRLDEVKSEFISVVSHQLRTPLSVARWNFELLLENAFGKLSPKVRNITRDTYKALMILNEGLNNLIAIIGMEEGKTMMRYETVEINQDIIEEAITSLKDEISEKNIIIKRRLSFKNDVVLDRQKMEKVCEIILDNAIRYSPPNSTIIISTALRRREGKNTLLISVEDEGIGILSENYELLFRKKFFRGEEAKKMSPAGFGLGLFMAREYVELHGGKLWLGEKKRPGSIFYFTIPIKM